MSPPFLVVPKGERYSCPWHNNQIQFSSEVTLCSGIEPNGSKCWRRDYSVLYDNQDDKGIFLCWYHKSQKRGLLARIQKDESGNTLQPVFSRRGELPSADIEVKIPGEKELRVIFPGWQFDALTHGYDPRIKASIRKVIEDYFAFLRRKRPKALKELRKEVGREPRKGEVDELDWRYRCHLARGWVYLLMNTPTDEGLTYATPGYQSQRRKGVLIKIGHTNAPRKRMETYEK
ncbi:hypothetical protein BGX26_007458, partial [Mortierella sp. AD094]